MIINNLGEDTKKLMTMEHMTQQNIADKTGIARPNVSRTISQNLVTDRWLDVIEALGYDVKITYVKRQKDTKEIVKNDKR